MKYGSFKNYANLITEGILVCEQYTLQELIDNFRKVFPYAKADCNIQHFRKEGDDTTDMTCYGQVQSETNPGRHYDVVVSFHRDDTEIPFTIKNIGKVNCTCNAYRYNTSHPNTKNSNQQEPIPNYAHIPNKERNPGRHSTICKHLYSFLLFLYNKGIIRNN